MTGRYVFAYACPIDANARLFGMGMIDKRPPWARVRFWFFFVVGTIWGSILGSWIILDGNHPWMYGYRPWAPEQLAEHALNDIAEASRHTDAGASAFVWIFALVSGVASALVGAAWFRRASPFAKDQRTRIVPPEGDE